MEYARHRKTNRQRTSSFAVTPMLRVLFPRILISPHFMIQTRKRVDTHSLRLPHGLLSRLDAVTTNHVLSIPWFPCSHNQQCWFSMMHSRGHQLAASASPGKCIWQSNIARAKPIWLNAASAPDFGRTDHMRSTKTVQLRVGLSRCSAPQWSSFTRRLS